MTTQQHAGGCLCGAVRFSIVHGGEVSVCHCSMCRRAMGGPMFAIICEGKPTFENRAMLGVYRSSEIAERGFCQRCGSQLFFHGLEDDSYAFTAGSFDDQSEMVITEQIFMADKPGFYALANETHEFRHDRIPDEA
ncbi:GFA family protein [Phytohalomonas tamaricis]|uniref:GFA family protein n=1 Tax=Phytohalomonas tamaricis TaxID=2081032 RepID=UPI000D0AE345|nr:GFA family protein [Phytohalomonas tamaricis]